MNMMTLKYFVYQIPLGIVAPVLYLIETEQEVVNSKFPLSGMCLRDYQDPGKFLFWDVEGNYICTSTFSEVRDWTINFPAILQCTITYPCKKQRNG